MLTEANAARYWNLLPWEFDQLSSPQKGKLVALYAVNKEVEYYYHKEAMRDTNSTTREQGRKMVRPKNLR